ncbi:MAG: histidine kinase N-terminal 7TM domain-containing protein [Eubacteriales bacterium]|nr:histidine kinase N-terminal 7TM domain-containing protein [Eubacteriales bacterium]
MIKVNKRGRQTMLAAAALVSAAIVCRILGMLDFHSWFFGMIRSAIYIFLFSAWAVSLNKRIMQVQLRRYMVCIAFAMLFWFLLRTAKFHLIPGEGRVDLMRFAWYSYYIPILAIPTLSLLAAVSMGTNEEFKLPPAAHLLWIPDIVLTAAVLTNDFHQKAFSFPDDQAVFSDKHASHEAVYWMAVIWISICAAAAMIIIIRKCRIPNSRRLLWLPLIPFFMMVVYSFAYLSEEKITLIAAGDMTAVYCLLIALLFESCIQCGLIRSNTHYTDLFMASAIAVKITDSDLNICYSSENAGHTDRMTLERAKSGETMLEGGVRLRSEPVKGGYVFWQEDISALLNVIRELAETESKLRRYERILKEKNNQKRRRKKLEEHKRLYDMVQEAMRPHIRQLEEILNDLKSYDDETLTRESLEKLLLKGTYIKRRSNMLIISDSHGRIPAVELSLCLKESLMILRSFGMAAAVQFSLQGSLTSETAGMIYDFYQLSVEAAADRPDGIMVFVSGDGGSARILIMIACAAGLNADMITDDFGNASVIEEDGTWYCSLEVRGGDH